MLFSDEIGLHRLENPSAYEEAMTLHVYIPSFNCTDRLYTQPPPRHTLYAVLVFNHACFDNGNL